MDAQLSIGLALFLNLQTRNKALVKRGSSVRMRERPPDGGSDIPLITVVMIPSHHAYGNRHLFRTHIFCLLSVRSEVLQSCTQTDGRLALSCMGNPYHASGELRSRFPSPIRPKQVRVMQAAGIGQRTPHSLTRSRGFREGVYRVCLQSTIRGHRRSTTG